MSRSIHTTRRSLKEAERFTYSASTVKQRKTLLRRLRKELLKKRQIKEQIKKKRAIAAEFLPPVAPESIPMCVLDEGEFIHYPASAADILNVMHLLPKGAIDGISCIQLCLGKEDQKDEWEPDPLVGRCGDEKLPGIFAGNVLGFYYPDKAKIQIFAYVYDSAMPNREMWELYLRLKMLSTFAHEVAHHNDYMTRMTRGRWLADSKEKKEIYAERMECEWVQRYAIPYLEKTYPEALKKLDAWIEYHGGLSIPLSLLAGDPRATAKNGLVKLIFDPSGAFESLVEDVAKGKSLIDTRLGFARRLHYDDEHYAEALEIIDRVLAEHPEHSEALTLKADIYEHQEKYDEAETLLKRVLSNDADYAEAWKILSLVHEARQDWENLLISATRATELEKRPVGWVLAIKRRARARLELGDFEGVEADITQLLERGKHFGKIQASKLREEMRSRIEQI